MDDDWGYPYDSGILHMELQVLVVGGGVSGLLSALFSARGATRATRATRVLLFEAGPEGMMRIGTMGNDTGILMFEHLYSIYLR